MRDRHSTFDSRFRGDVPRRTRWRVTPRLRRAITVLVIVWVGGVYGLGFARIAQERDRVDELAAKLASTEQRISDLQRKIEIRKSDAYVERIARDELGLVKPGEVRYQFVLPPDPTDPYYVPERKGDPPDPNGGY